MSWLIAHFLAVFTGVSLGLIGGGGSILAVPILVYVMNIPTYTAMAMSLAMVGFVSLIGIIFYTIQGQVNFKTAFLFTPCAMVGAYLGAKLTALEFVTPKVQLITFAIMMLVAAWLMIKKKKDFIASTYWSKIVHIFPNWLMIFLEGLTVGILTGFVGIGGGFMIIPALVLLEEIPIKEAVGTSLVIIVFKSMAGFAGYLQQVSINWNLTLSFTIAASLGMLIGAYLTQFIQAQNLEKSFGSFILLVAMFILVNQTIAPGSSFNP